MVYRIQDVIRVTVGDIWQTADGRNYLVTETELEHITICSEANSKEYDVHFQDFYRLYYFVK